MLPTRVVAPITVMLLDLEPDGARARPLAEHHVEREVLHRRIEDLLDHVREAMDLVDEQHVALVQGREDRGQVAGTLDRGARGGADLRTHLGGHDVGEGRLAQAGRAVEEDVIDRLLAVAGGVDQDRQVLLDPILAGELVEAPRPDGRLEGDLVLGDDGAGDPLDGHCRPFYGPPMRSRSAGVSMSSGMSREPRRRDQARGVRGTAVAGPRPR